MKTSPTYPTHLITVFALASAIVLTSCGQERSEAMPQAPTATPTSHRQQQQQQPSEVQQRTRPAVRTLMVTSDSVGIQLIAENGLRGRVKSIEPISSLRKTHGVGAVAGGVIGGVLGNQIGGGSGNTAATVVGAVGGAVVGNQIEKHRKSNVTSYRVNVQMDNGEMRHFEQATLNGLKVGDRVRANGTQLARS